MRRATREHGGASLWDMAEGQPAPEGPDAGDGPAFMPAARVLTDRLLAAHRQRAATGRRHVGAPAADDGNLQNEMLQFVMALDERSLMPRNVIADATVGAPLPRRYEPEPLTSRLPRRARSSTSTSTSASATASTASATNDECPSCGGRQLRVDELDFDAETCVRTCIDCGATFSSTI